MKAKTIRLVLKKKMEGWLASIEDEEIRELVAKNTIITGGCIASMLLNEKINDFDVYFKSKDVAFKVAQYYVGRFSPKNKKGIDIEIYAENLPDRVKIMVRSAGIASEDGTEKPYQYFEAEAEGEAGAYVSEIISDPGDIEDVYQGTEEKSQEVQGQRYRPVFLSTNAITLSDRIQVVLRFSGEPDAIHENYDYVHCTNYWSSWDDHLELRPAALEALLAKELVYVGSKYPVCSIFRLRKFLRRGWQINAGQILKILLQISALHLEDIETLQDQLTGVDCAYFMEVMTAVKAKDPQKVNTAYLIEVIDRMF